MTEQMAQTAIVQEIDGLQIVTGFGRRSIEPAQTRAVVAGLIGETAEAEAVAAKRAQIEGVYASARAAANEKRAQDYLDCQAQAHALMAELADLLPALKTKTQALMTEHAVYFEPARYEHPQSDTQIDALRSKMAGPNRVSLDGLEIEDHRGKTACVLDSGAWTVRRILTMGEKLPAGGILVEDLDDAQRVGVELQIERDSAALMSGGQRAAARMAAEERALAASVSMRSGLEIQDDPDSLEKSRAVYDARMAEIAGIYG